MIHPPLDSNAPELLCYRSSGFEHFTDGLMITTLEGKIVDWNPGATRIFGWTREEMLGRTPAVLHRPCDAVLTDSINEAAATAGTWSGEIVFIRKDGTTGICATTTVPMRDANGAVFATLGVNRDITAENTAQAKILEQKRLLQSLVDALADPIFIKDAERKFLLVNSVHGSLWNISSEDALGKSDEDVPALQEHAALYAADDEEVLRTGVPVINREEPYLLANGQSGWFLTSKYPLRDSAGAIIGIVGTCRDVTERLQVARALADEREKLRTVLDAVQDPVFVKDREGRQTLQNEAGRRFFGEGHGCSAETPQPAEDRIVFATGAPLANREEPFQLPDGTSGTLLISRFPLRDSAGAVVGLVGIGRDITRLRQDAADREALQAKLVEAQKLESLGVLAGGIAHDFNNLLGVVLGNASLALATRKDEGCVPFLQEIEKAVTRASDLCKQMLAYSGRGNFVVRPLDLNVIITETADLLRVTIHKNVELKRNLAPQLPATIGDETQLRQVLMNLVINASESIPERGGQVTVSTCVLGAGWSGANALALPGELKPGTYLCLQVADTGEGMTPEVLAKIFDPFFTTKFTGRGLGLAAVHGIVRAHHGALTVESKPGAGTTFRIFLPCADAPSALAPATSAPALPAEGWQGKGSALVADDEEGVRVVVSNVLKRLGFAPRAFVDGTSALKAFREAPDSFSLVLADLTMPGLNGAQLCQEVHRLRPALPTLLMSGFSEKEVLARLNGERNFELLQKPFTMAAFRECLQRVMSPEAADAFLLS